ncbi:hypothetical protein [Formosa sp. A9]|uniref:hypothetical protein n=1 Tax=Formosa sp. A9 TaxID=3442641 RepID=UPI003EBD02C7
MEANDVYKIAKALPENEFIKLFELLKGNIKCNLPQKRKRKPLPDFTIEDGIEYLINNHFNTIRIP